MVILIAADIVLERLWWWGQGVTHQTFSISVADVSQNIREKSFWIDLHTGLVT